MDPDKGILSIGSYTLRARMLWYGSVVLVVVFWRQAFHQVLGSLEPTDSFAILHSWMYTSLVDMTTTLERDKSPRSQLVYALGCIPATKDHDVAHVRSIHTIDTISLRFIHVFKGILFFLLRLKEES